MCTVFIYYVYINTHTYSIYFENIYMQCLIWAGSCRILFRKMSDFGFCVPVFVFKDLALTSADRDSACVHIRDRAIAGLCRCIWSMICRLCIGPQHIIDQSAFLNSKSLSWLVLLLNPLSPKVPLLTTIICFVSSGNIWRECNNTRNKTK